MRVATSLERAPYRVTLCWLIHPCLHPGFTLEVEELRGEETVRGLIINGDTYGFVEAEALLKEAVERLPDVRQAYQESLGRAAGDC